MTRFLQFSRGPGGNCRRPYRAIRAAVSLYRAGTDVPKFLLISWYIYGSNILECIHQRIGFQKKRPSAHWLQ